MARKIFFVHGRDIKPSAENLRRIWLDALQLGLEEFRPAELPRLADTPSQMIYFGDISLKFLRSALRRKSALLDGRKVLARYEATTAALRSTVDRLHRRAFSLRRTGRAHWKFLIVRTFCIFAEATVAGEVIIRRCAPDVRDYWKVRSRLHAQIEDRMQPVAESLENGDDILLISHSLGTVICYDFLWNLSHGGGRRTDAAKTNVDVWITLGSPLGDELFKQKLRGHRRRRRHRYPDNIRRWINISAHDDYVCHDPTVGDDYREMLDFHHVDEIRDHRIRNPALRDGEPHPHAVQGYLAHPVTIDYVARWLAKA